jgi:hypothetical protein
MVGDRRNYEFFGLIASSSSDFVEELALINEELLIRGTDVLAMDRCASRSQFCLDDEGNFSTLLLKQLSQLRSLYKLDTQGDLLDGFWVKGIVLDQSQNIVFCGLLLLRTSELLKGLFLFEQLH